MTTPPTPQGPMAHQRPFARFDDLFAADPYPLAAAGLELFRQPELELDVLRAWLRGLVVEQPASVLGLAISTPRVLEATLQRMLLLWERALVAARVIEGRDVISVRVLLLAPSVPTQPYGERLALVRGEAVSDFR